MMHHAGHHSKRDHKEAPALKPLVRTAGIEDMPVLVGLMGEAKAVGATSS